MTNRDQMVNWPSAVVACMLIVLVGAIAVTAIIMYEIESALKIWAALGTLVGVLTGAFVSYFFSRTSIEGARAVAALAQEKASALQAQLDDCDNALRVAIRYLSPDAMKEMSADEKHTLMRLGS